MYAGRLLDLAANPTDQLERASKQRESTLVTLKKFSYKTPQNPKKIKKISPILHWNSAKKKKIRDGNRTN